MNRQKERRCFLQASWRSSVAAWGLTHLIACDRPTAAVQFKSTDITGADYAKTLVLPDTDNQVRSLEEFKGQVLFVFFGYTQCPDVCPTTMHEVAQARQLLGDEGARVQSIFVTIDPERDTPEMLKAYAQGLDPGLLALRGTPEQLAAVARGFKVFYQKVPAKVEGHYTMDHTAGAYVFDPKGRVRLFVRYGTPVDSLVEDLRHLIRGA